MTGPASIRPLSVVVLSISLLICAGCGVMPGGTVDRDDVARLVAQLEGGRCAFHTDPTHEQLDDSCKRHGWNTWGVRLTAGRHRCAMWAAECLGQLGNGAHPALDSMISALENGPNNFDTGDGIIPARDAVARALGRIGDPRAVGPLLDALRNPRPVDAGPGAIGYASEVPVGQVAALEGLGYVGPAASAAVPDILGVLSLPVETDLDLPRFSAAADALAKIGDRRAIPALVAHLEDARRRGPAARSLGEFGSLAESVGPTLVALVQRFPDAEGNEEVRKAVSRILGRERAQRLPPNYDLQMGILWRAVADATKKHGCSRRALNIDSAREVFTTEIGEGVSVRVHFDRRRWVEERRVSGRLEPAGDGVEPVQDFRSLAAFDTGLQDLLLKYCGPATDERD